MKSIILAISLFAGVQAFASAKSNCVPEFIGTGEGGQGYYINPCDKGVTTHKACLEGEVGYFPTGEYTGEGGRYEVARTCHNGTFFPSYKGAAPAIKRCIEGEVTYVSTGEYRGEGGPAETAVVCHHGRFVKP